jgi:hypothetical protein
MVIHMWCFVDLCSTLRVPWVTTALSRRAVVVIKILMLALVKPLELITTLFTRISLKKQIIANKDHEPAKNRGK